MKPTKVNLAEKTVWIGETKYWYKLRNHRRIWYRNSRTYAYVEEEQFPIKELEEAEGRGEITFDGWEPLERRVKDSKKLKQLNKILFHALEKEMRRREHKRKQHDKKVGTQNEAPPQGDTPQQDDGLQKRTKWGIRINSSDGKHFFVLGCWKSTKYPGSVSIRLGRYLYTISQDDLKAMQEELRRGMQPEIPQKPI